MRKHCVHILLSIFAISFTGCASIIDGTKQNVTFNSDPSAAEVIIGGVTRGNTPLSITLKRKTMGGGEVFALLKKEGYQDQQVQLSTKLNGWFWGNIITGGLIGSTTDGISGAAFEYSPDSYHITLSPLRSSQAEKNLLRKKMWARIFVLNNYSQIASDLARGEGEYLSSLYDLFAIDDTHPEEALDHLREMFWRHQDIPAFADAVISYYPLRSDG